MKADRARLTAHLAFPLDGFQTRAMDALDAGESVLVAAPTGSGKTVVAEYAIALALAAGKRAFYTTPVKALSNQKFTDLTRLFGAARVGLLTGDNAFNGDAEVVVMTTEVLRNMIYARSNGLASLGCVVLDEVHYIQDTYRGPVWEEVIIHLAHHVQLACLSATVSNAEELADWMSTVRGPTKAIIEEQRPVRLENLYFVGDKTSERMHLLPTLVGGRPNSEAQRIDEEGTRNWKTTKGGRRIGARRTLYAPGRLEVVERLDAEDMLPAIYFIFSRNQCDEAANACLATGLRLTTGDERERIREIADRRLDGIDVVDLSVLGYSQFMACLEAGFAAHHAGMVPPFKEVVEACFTEGLIKVVFATETLAVGINMPARSVVIEKLTKFTGDHHEFLKPGEYTQLTGRAGRRGIDTLGHAVVLWNPFVPFDQVAGLASSRSFHLTSAFRPTYNMACNLVRTYDSEQAHRLLNQSFAQYQADRDVVKMETRLQHREAHVARLREKVQSPFGDIEEYRALLAGSGNRAERRSGRFRDDEAIRLSLMKLRPGDIVYFEKGRYAGKATVLATAHRKGKIRLSLMTMRRESVQAVEEDFEQPVRALASFNLPVPFAPGKQDFQRAVVHVMEKARLEPKTASEAEPPGSIRRKSQPHPVEEDPDLEERLAAAAQIERIEREVLDLSRRVRGTSQSLARQFDRVLRILARRGHVDGWRLTARGRVLASTFHECDLLIVEVLLAGELDGLDPATMAGMVSVFTYEHRSPEGPPAAWFPSLDAKKRWRRIEQISAELADEEQQAGLTPHRLPDPTYVAVAFAWAAGEAFADVVEAEELSGGDFVRNIRQLIDLLRQLGQIAPVEATRRSANQAADALLRGVVEASNAVGVVTVGDDSPEVAAADETPI